ncbi:MAG: DUF3025 domain-containing protein [Gammaproteobacteria bacterium]
MLDAIDWARPWLDSVRPAYARLDLGLDRTEGIIPALNARARTLALTNHGGLLLRFVPQAELPEGRAYEEFIGATGCVPTRENLHDFFNALVWLTFPRIKRELNALQAAQIAMAGVGKSRGPARDAATLFDENCALLVVQDDVHGHALVDALRAHRWVEGLFERRAQFGLGAEVWLFGHALMEKLTAPRKAITAHTRVVLAGVDYFQLDGESRRAWIDAHVAAQIAEHGLDTSCFTPLQALGVPGWWEGQDKAFYEDTSVFRPKRVNQKEKL